MPNHDKFLYALVGAHQGKVTSGQRVIPASTAVVLATFTRTAGWSCWFTVFGSDKTVSYLIANETGGIPANQDCRVVFRKTITTDEMELLASNGLEEITLDWTLFAVAP